MASTETLHKVKLFLRISHAALDDDISSDIDACLSDLEMHGIADPKESDPLIYNAVKLYCKSLYTDDNAKSMEWLRRYEALRDSLNMAEGYGWTAEEAGANE